MTFFRATPNFLSCLASHALDRCTFELRTAQGPRHAVVYWYCCGALGGVVCVREQQRSRTCVDLTEMAYFIRVDISAFCTHKVPVLQRWLLIANVPDRNIVCYNTSRETQLRFHRRRFSLAEERRSAHTLKPQNTLYFAISRRQNHGYKS